ncbi:MAG: hypothetical protein LQ347_001119 [Umbilicaria vellea]|nr:MAG: hypothetical protein LQ347_001119 [Umbilicaria vellea]
MPSTLENSDKPCDTGTPIAAISTEFPSFDFNTVSPEYPSKEGRWAFSVAAITQRGRDCRQWLKSRPEKVIAVVTHSGFLRLGVSHTKYANADYRVFDFADDTSDELVEWESTEHQGGGMGKSEKGTAYTRGSDFRHERRKGTAEAKGALGEVDEEVPG